MAKIGLRSALNIILSVDDIATLPKSWLSQLIASPVIFGFSHMISPLAKILQILTKIHCSGYNDIQNILELPILDGLEY